jgi:hypothetical protein
MIYPSHVCSPSIPIFFSSNHQTQPQDNEVALQYTSISINQIKLCREFSRCLRPSLSCRCPLRDEPRILACPAVQQPQRAYSISANPTSLDEVYQTFNVSSLQAHCGRQQGGSFSETQSLTLKRTKIFKLSPSIVWASHAHFTYSNN